MTQIIAYIQENPMSESKSTQATAITQWANEHDFPIRDIYFENISSPELPMKQRVGLMQALNHLQPMDILLTYTRSIFLLNPMTLALFQREVKKKGAMIRSVIEPEEDLIESNPEIQQALEWIRHYEQEIVNAKIKTALSHCQSKNQRTGTVPLGKSVIEGTTDLEPNQKEIEIVNYVRRLRNERVSLQTIQDRLAEEGVVCRSGRLPSIPTISRWALSEPSPHQDRKRRRPRLETIYPELGEIVRSKRRDGWTLKEITGHLNELGFQTSRGKPLQLAQIYRVVKRVGVD